MVERITGAASPVSGAAYTAVQVTDEGFGEVWQQVAAGDVPGAEVAPAPETGAEALSASLTSLLRNRDGIEGSLMTLCVLMGQNAAGLEPLVAMLAAMVALLSPEDSQKLWKKTMDSDHAPEVLDRVDEEVFAAQFALDTPYQAWKASTPGIVSTEEDRSPERYRAVIDQFDVTDNARYQPNKKGEGDTYCNIFTWDVTSAMNAELPHYVDQETGDIRTYPHTQGAMELNANRTYDWLAQHGGRYGWRRVTAQEAQDCADRGMPAVTVLKRPGRHGHLQVICPSEEGGYDEGRGVSVAQAGSRNYGYAYLGDIAAAPSRSDIAYYVHA